MLERWFKLSERQTDTRTELIAGLTTFLTAAYFVFVNPNILSATGMDKGALITVTCIVAGISSILMGLWANAPIMMAPGMGLNAFFAFSRRPDRLRYEHHSQLCLRESGDKGHEPRAGTFRPSGGVY